MGGRQSVKVLQSSELRPAICIVVGTRPGIVMMSPLIRELDRVGQDYFVLHTGQHYSPNMDAQFFENLRLPKPHHKLDGIHNCAYHGEQTAEMLRGSEEVFIQERPRIVLVGGDANTNLAGALAARKLHIRVGHIEAGERSFDWRMPEEHNRVVIDHISDYLFTTNDKGRQHLRNDNVLGRVYVAGNPIVDAAQQNLEIANEQSTVLRDWDLDPGAYFLLTLHREENVDSQATLESILGALEAVIQQHGYPIVFPAHPRTLKRLREFGLEAYAQAIEGLDIKEAAGYLDFLKLIGNARLVLTDSGGVQQESCILRIPCVTLRDNTEWTETVEMGANVLGGASTEHILKSVETMLEAEPDWTIPFGDGHSAERIVEILRRELDGE